MTEVNPAALLEVERQIRMALMADGVPLEHIDEIAPKLARAAIDEYLKEFRHER